MGAADAAKIIIRLIVELIKPQICIRELLSFLLIIYILKLAPSQ